MRVFSKFSLLFLVLLMCLPCSSQEGRAGQPAAQPEEHFFSADSCKWLPTDIAHAEVLHGVCEHAMSLPQKMPNFICEKEASRYRGENRVPRDLFTALVRYEDGQESYSDVKWNGKPAKSATAGSAAGLWSTGEFGNDLRAIFDLNNGPLFEFAGEKALGARPVWVFKYLIAKQTDPLWRLRTGDGMLAPAYTGELWVDEKTGDLLRFRAVAQHIPETFPIQQAELQTDYETVEFADGGSFLLPTEAVIRTKMIGEELTRNVLKFRNCHKFRAKAQILVNTGAAREESASAPAWTSAELAREIEEQETIYAILREDAVREDTAQLEKEQAEDLQASTIAELWSYIRQVRKMRREAARQLALTARPALPEASEGVPTFRTGARLVPVSVVLRDSKGHVLGDVRKEDFQLFDNGKAQAITSFSLEKSTSGDQPASGASSQAGGSAFASDSRQQVTAEPERDVAYVFDDVHAAIELLAGAGAAASRHIAAMRADDRAALFTTSGQVVVDFTNDREKLQAAIRELKPHTSIDQHGCPPVSYYMADQMVNQGDMETIGLATSEAIDCAFHGFNASSDQSQAQKLAASKAFEVLNRGNWDSQRTLQVLREVVRRTAAMPGRRSIVLVSPGFLTLNPEMRAAVMDLMDRSLESDVPISTLDVRGLGTIGSVADLDHPARLQVDREEAELQTGLLAQLANGTGGIYFHHNNDMDEGFRRTADAPEFVYVLGFSPQKLDGKFHKLKVTVKGSTKLTVQAREGYYALKPASGS
jgi:VWFA-related protein